MASTPDSGAAECEGYEEWGYLFKPDKTGTGKLKKLLRALQRNISTKFESYDSLDLTPIQLAHFYRELSGNYDQLFLSTPPATIAFIYKNLGCLHSLQPALSPSSGKRFFDPTIPALKTEGWIMWETIQLLLAPDEHAAFLIKAVRKWDLVDPDTGAPLPKVLSRRCFPAKPDAHMTAWYEGMSERLRREAEEEQAMRVTAMNEEPRRQIEAVHRRHDHGHDSSDEAHSESKRSSALAYFRNPLFRNKDGGQEVTRRNSKHQTLMERGKTTATSIGHVVRNIGSPHLWDGGNYKEVHWAHTHRDSDREDVRRKSLPHRTSRRGSAAPSPTSDKEQGSKHQSRQTSPRTDHTIRHSKSHDPTQSPKEYFPPYDSYRERRSSVHSQSPVDQTTSPPSAGDGPERDAVRRGFMPTASPLFATQVARGEYRSNYARNNSSSSRSPPNRSGSVRRRPTNGDTPPPPPNAARPRVSRFSSPVGGGA